MKLIACTLLDIDEYLQRENTNRVLTLFRRVHAVQRMMIEQIGLLETMSPKEYQAIRQRLGNGSGQESPGFRTLLKIYQPIWNSFAEFYLARHGLTVEKIYDSQYNHGDAYVVAEAMAEFDELFQKFRFEHMQLIHRTIGFESKSLKGRPVEILEEGMRHKFFPELWEKRDDRPLGRGVRSKTRTDRRAPLDNHWPRERKNPIGCGWGSLEAVHRDGRIPPAITGTAGISRRRSSVRRGLRSPHSLLRRTCTHIRKRRAASGRRRGAPPTCCWHS
jgi:hypothetical protein